MPPVLAIAAGFILLALFLFGGKAQGGGERTYIASAARAFVAPWLVITLGNVWVRWWNGAPLWSELGWGLVVAIVPIAASFLMWRRLRSSV